MYLIVKCDTDDVGHKNVCILQINNVSSVFDSSIFAMYESYNANFDASQVSEKQSKTPKKNVDCLLNICILLWKLYGSLLTSCPSHDNEITRNISYLSFESKWAI